MPAPSRTSRSLAIGTHQLEIALAGLSCSEQEKCWSLSTGELLRADVAGMLAAASTGDVAAAHERLTRINRRCQDDGTTLDGEHAWAIRLSKHLMRSDSLSVTRNEVFPTRSVADRGPTSESSQALAAWLECEAQVRQGRINQAVKTMLELRQVTGSNAEVAMVSRTFLARLFGQFGRWEDARDQLASIHPETGSASTLARARFHIVQSRTFARLSEVEQASEASLQARCLLAEDHWPVLAGELSIVDADLNLRVGELEAAEHLIEGSCKELIRRQNCFHEMKAKEVLARIRLAQGDSDAAWSILQDPRVTAMPRSFRWLVSRSRARILRERGQWKTLAVEHDLALKIQSKSESDLLRTHAALWSRKTENDREHNRVDLAVLNEQLVSAGDEIDKLLSIVSHDLRSPLLAMSLAVQLAGNEHDLEKRRRHVSSAIATLRRVQQISLQLSALEGLEGDRGSVALLTTDLMPVVADVVERYQAAAQHKGIELLVVTDPDCGQLMATTDEPKVVHILENLISNALKFSAGGSVVEVLINEAIQETERGGRSCLSISVSDEGPGFAESDRERLFGRYVRLEAQPTNGESSSGLGLHIAQTFAHSVAGHIEAASGGRGKGATFTLFLPAENAVLTPQLQDL